MAVSDEQYAAVSASLQKMRPALTDDLTQSLANEPQIAERYKGEVRPLAEQGVASFCDVLLGALKYDVPGLVSHELGWLDKLLKARQINGERVDIFLQIFRQRVISDMPPDQQAVIMRVLDAAEARLKEN
jgi:hypothetical protein